MGRATWPAFLAVFIWACLSPSGPSPTAAETTTVIPGTTTTTTTIPPQPTSTPGGPGTTLRVGRVVTVSSLDPADAFTLGDWEILHAVSEGPLVAEPGNGELRPGIAQDLPQVSDSGRAYTIRLRKDTVFADGHQLTAPIYVEGLRRVMELGGQASDLLLLFVDGVEAPDEETVVFRLKDAYAFFPTLLAGAAYLPVHPEDYPADALTPFPEPPIFGVGPFFIADYSDTELVLQRNPNYPGGELDGVVVRSYGSIEDAAEALATGDLDLVWRGVDAESAVRLDAAGDVTVAAAPGGTPQFLVVNHGLVPTDDPLVRRALAEVIDREALVDQALGGRVEPSFSVVPEGFLGSSQSFADVYGPESDVTEAIRFLTEAGFTEANPAELELAYPPERFGVDVAQAMEMLERQIEGTGLVEVTLTAQPWNAYVGDVVAGRYNLALLSWLYNFPDPHDYIAPFVLEGGIGGSGRGLDPSILPALTQEAAIELDESRRERLYREIQILYAGEVVTLPLWITPEYIAYRDRVAGNSALSYPETLNVGPQMLLDFRTIEMEDG